MLHTVEADIPMRPLDPVSVATNIQCREPAYIYGAHPTGKGVGLGTFGLYRPQILRSKALHASKSNCGASRTSSP